MRSGIAVLLACVAAGSLCAQSPKETGAGTPPLSQDAAAARVSTVAAIRESGLEKLPLPEEIPSGLLNEAVALLFFAVVPGQDETVAWKAHELRYTIPGTPVSVRMVGVDAIIVVSVTPYRGSGDQLMLVTQGQVWYKEGNEGLRYRSTFDTLELKYGERVFFYPFGVREDGSAAMRIELLIDSFRMMEIAWASMQTTSAAPLPETVKP